MRPNRLTRPRQTRTIHVKRRYKQLLMRLRPAKRRRLPSVAVVGLPPFGCQPVVKAVTQPTRRRIEKAVAVRRLSVTRSPKGYMQKSISMLMKNAVDPKANRRGLPAQLKPHPAILGVWQTFNTIIRRLNLKSSFTTWLTRVTTGRTPTHTSITARYNGGAKINLPNRSSFAPCSGRMTKASC